MTWAEYVERVTVEFPLPMEVWALSNPGSPDDVELRANLHAPDISGDRILVTVVDFPPPIATIEDPARYLRTLLLRVLAHELDETLRVDGVKARDPRQRTATTDSPACESCVAFSRRRRW